MGKIKKLISPRSSPQKGADRACRGYAAPLRRSSNQFPRETDQEAAKTQGRFLPQESVQRTSFSRDNAHPAYPQGSPGAAQESLPRPPAARAPIQTRSRTAAALHSDLPLPSEETTDVFINPHFEEPSSPIVPVTVEGSSSSREPDSEECLAGFPEPKQRSNDQNIKNPWNIFDSYTVPPSAFATPQPAAPKPAPRVDSPPKKRRLSSRKAHRRAEWFTDPSRPKLDTIPEAPSLEVENEDESRLSSPLNFTFLVNTSQQSFFEIENPPSEVELSQNSKGIDSDELTTSEEDPKDQAPSGWPANGPKEERSSPKPNPKMILSSLFNMLEQDSI
ncbi:hypothetical protein Pst134EA_002830 [Puccinia striiformis f. sp. tritici]|uniref:hypothetical protein n=1 Tax=Puccinia striiformis f. sp. tritici TaxID=168172 RepID=UPI002007E640|nr:hypothetical protein Pst134EA_002830 [Puccinia striiformis f. sp. tritici]KAH9472207.1 hypothetical protein Pst134EA_002830 [Puccinia striiformis f. sp. tritici]